MKLFARLAPNFALALLAVACTTPHSASGPDPAAAPIQPAESNAPNNAASAAAPSAPTVPLASETPGASTASSAIVLARIDGDPLTLDDALATFVSSHTGHGSLVHGEAELKQLTARVIEQRLFYREAAALGLPDAPDVKDAVAAFRHNTAAQRFWKREIDDKVKVTDDEVETFYAKTDLALHLWLMVASDRAAADELRARIERGEDFAELARSQSIDDSKNYGGELPFVRRGELDSALEQAAFELTEPNSLTPVVPTAKGFAFARLAERIVNTERPSRAVALPQIRSILEERQRKEYRSAIEERVLSESGAKLDESLCTTESLAGSANAEGLVASVGEEKLTLGDLREAMDLERLQAAPAKQAGDAIREFARSWTLQRAVSRFVDSSGMLDEPELAKLTESFHRGAVLQKLYNEYVYADLDTSEAKLKAYYDAHLADQFTRPDEVRLALVQLPTELEASEVRSRALLGADFKSLAQQYSHDKTSAQHGGSIGWIRPGRIEAPVEARAFALPVGSVDGPIEADGAWFVIKVLDRRESAVIAFEDARPAVEKNLVKELQRSAYDTWAKRLRDRAKVEIDGDAIRRAAAELAAKGAAKQDSKPEHGSAGEKGSP